MCGGGRAGSLYDVVGEEAANTAILLSVMGMPIGAGGVELGRRGHVPSFVGMGCPNTDPAPTARRVAEVWRPTLVDVVEAAAVILEAEPEQIERLPGLTLAESALVAPFAGFGDSDAYPACSTRRRC